MASATINISVIQPDIVWEDKAANLKQYEQYIANIAEKRQIVVLPEMFSTGFSMAPQRLAETMTGTTVTWMKEMTLKHRCILTGSVIIEEEGKYYNRLLWVQPDGTIYHYDKRHLFAYAGEDKQYTSGSNRLIVQVSGWRICVQVCYDLRFPVWARNKKEEYDLLLYVANWPQKRSLAWRTLLQARAIENMSYVVGVNRVGMDGKDIIYNGESAVYGPLGELLWQQAQDAVCHTLTLDKNTLSQTRTEYPFLRDADDFMIL